MAYVPSMLSWRGDHWQLSDDPDQEGRFVVDWQPPPRLEQFEVSQNQLTSTKVLAVEQLVSARAVTGFSRGRVKGLRPADSSATLDRTMMYQQE